MAIRAIYRNGQLELLDPVDIRDGEEVRIQILPESGVSNPDVEWTDEEIDAAINIKPVNGAQIVQTLGPGWEDLSVSGTEWVNLLRRKRREAKSW